jgi:hypothetical protein
MTPVPSLQPPISALEETRETLYQLADRCPALSLPLSVAAVRITEVLTAITNPGNKPQELQGRLLAAANAVAAARHAALDENLQLELARRFDLLSRARELGPTTRTRPTRHLSLVHSA